MTQLLKIVFYQIHYKSYTCEPIIQFNVSPGIEYHRKVKIVLCGYWRFQRNHYGRIDRMYIRTGFHRHSFRLKPIKLVVFPIYPCIETHRQLTTDDSCTSTTNDYRIALDLRQQYERK